MSVELDSPRSLSLAVLLVSCWIFLQGVDCQAGDARLSRNMCSRQTTCGACISTSPLCSWCNDKVYSSSSQKPFQRCDYHTNHVGRGCKVFVDPKSSSSVVEDDAISDTSRVSPKSVRVSLRPGLPTTLSMKVRMPVNFPVDLYYLMDMSYSLLDDLDKIKDIGRILSNTMANITSNFRLGFGGFVDKPTAPFMDTHPIKLAAPAANAQPTFGFRNFLPLDPNPQVFENTVSRIKISGNVDKPEGSMEALMQVAVCEQEIGWKPKDEARRIVIITTDAPFHISGDGLMAGIVTPNDGGCHLQDNNYTASTLMDYPSLGQLRESLISNQVVPIFAITKGEVQLYERVAKYMGAEVGAISERLEDDSSNVVDLIREAYQRIAETLTLTTDTIEGLDVSIFAICPKSKGAFTRTCSNVSVGQEVFFNVTFTLQQCSAELKNRSKFSLSTIFGSIKVELDPHCDCACEKHPMAELSSKCNYAGRVACEECQCLPGYSGRFCQCDELTAKNDSFCIKDGKVCSDKGTCVCGECKCDKSPNENEEYYGDFCECSNATCLISHDEICGGPERGMCDCGSCVCQPNWIGPACGEACPSANNTCLDQQGILCSGHGVCECGRCRCNENYMGPFCEDCKTCCTVAQPCVQCHVFQTGPLKRDQCRSQCKDTIVMVDSIDVGHPQRCVFRDDDDCSVIFRYEKNLQYGNQTLYVQKDKICPASANITAILAGVIGAVLGLGILLILIWKLLATIQDRREYAEFQKEQNQAKWDMALNPIFKQATQTFSNPSYESRS